MIRPTSIGKVYRPISANKPVQSMQIPVRVQQTGTTTTQPVSDRVQISREGAFQSRLAESVVAMSKEAATTVSPQKLADLKQQIADGTYQIPASDLADAIMGRIALTKEAY
ncbi:MAG: flagellar biosynthesis anti-sigma factor FlgM [Clostridiales bacterium]|jgi:anti-sigma28 factor (negative regulator of flagellin synthesis)|nr:flagellar biosynthesis anti-sigma factor FlgM [Clostridiales bacterium]